jgi:hypothetical protein
MGSWPVGVRLQHDHVRGDGTISGRCTFDVGARNDEAHWVEAERVCQCFALQTTALGLKVAFVNQSVEAPTLRDRFAAFLGLGDRRPDFVGAPKQVPICRNLCGVP